MKKICIILIAIILLTMLTACGGSTSTTQNPAIDRLEDLAQQHAGSPIRGSWDGNVFTSEHLGLRFVKPDGWMALTDVQIAEMTGRGIEQSLDSTDLDELMELLGVTIFTDMGAVGTYTLGHVQIVYERLPNQFEFSAPQLVESMAELYAQNGFEANLDFSGTTRIGAYNWYVGGATITDSSGVQYFIRYFVTIRNEFGVAITIGYDAESETLEEILAMFSPL